MKLQTNTITSGYRAVESLNENFSDVATAIENTLSRDGTGPNFMSAPLDMNDNRIINLHKPIDPNDGARLKDITDAVNRIIAPVVGSTSYNSTVDIRSYITPDMAISDIGADPSTFFDVSELVRQAQYDAGLLGVLVDYSQLRGAYFMDPIVPIKVYKGSGMTFPTANRLILGYNTSGGFKDSISTFNGLAFIVNPLSSRRTTKPVVVIEGSTILTGPVQFAGVGLAKALGQNLVVSSYPTITGTIPSHAPIVACDCTNSKPGAITADLHIVGVMQGFYLGDPLTSEEPWAAGFNSASGIAPNGKNGAASFGRIVITGAPCQRLFGFARGTAGGLQLYVQAIPPYWTGISQPNSGGSDLGHGLNQYAALKLFQQTGIAMDFWHRAVGFTIDAHLRGFHTGLKLQAGAGPTISGVVIGGPDGQDTGKYNAGTVQMNVERVICLLDVDQYSYLHHVDFRFGGHCMDEYNLKGENTPAIWIKSDQTKAGSVDKATGSPWLPNTQYFTNDKVTNGGLIYNCTQSGTSASSGGPSGSNTTTSVADGTCRWIYRNGGFKPFGYPSFARARFSGNLNEVSGGLFENTINDGHLFYNFDYSEISNWKQANTHHNEPLFWNKSASAVLRHMNSALFASANSKYVYNVLDHDRLHLGSNEYFGYTLPGDGSDPPEICNDPLVDFPNCNAYPFAVAQGDDDDDSDDEV